MDSDQELSDEEDLIESGIFFTCSINAGCRVSLFLDFIDDTPHAPHGEARDSFPPTPATAFPSSTPTSSTAPSFLSQLVGQIQAKYVERPFPEAGHDCEPEGHNGVENQAYEQSLVPHTEDWGLWRIKCKVYRVISSKSIQSHLFSQPSQEYFLLYELMMKH